MLATVAMAIGVASCPPSTRHSWLPITRHQMAFGRWPRATSTGHAMDGIKKRIAKAQSRHNYRAKVKLGGHERARGAGLFSQHARIVEGEVIAYYPIELIVDPGPGTRDPLRHYFIEVETATGAPSVRYTGRPDLQAIATAPSAPLRIPFTGAFANEPGLGVPANAELVSAPRRKGDNLVTGAKRVYKLVALRDIELRGEVFVCYGEYFDRGTPPYATSCTCCA